MSECKLCYEILNRQFMWRPDLFNAFNFLAEKVRKPFSFYFYLEALRSASLVWSEPVRLDPVESLSMTEIQKTRIFWSNCTHWGYIWERLSQQDFPKNKKMENLVRSLKNIDLKQSAV